MDVSALSAWIANNSKAIASKAVTGAQTAQLLIQNKAVQLGVKGKQAILKMDSDVTFQDGSACSRSAVGNTVLSDKYIQVIPLKDNQNVCTKSLWNTYYSELLLAGETPQEQLDSKFAQSIMDYRAKKIATTNETLLWQGDTTLTGATNNKWINGILKLHTSGGGTSASATGTTTVEQLQTIYMATPIAVRTQDDFRIFMGSDTYAKYTIALANKNIYKPTEDFTVFGTPAKFVVVDGLNGTGKVYATRISNLQLGLDGSDDEQKAEFRYSIEQNLYYVDFCWAIGVSVINESEALIGTGF